MLCHSDYKKWDQADVLGWQQYDWTGPQRAAISKHNARNPTQRILLADATARAALFGEHSAAALQEHVGDPQDEKARGIKGTARDDWAIPQVASSERQ
jgi:hypothetical protein